MDCNKYFYNEKKKQEKKKKCDGMQSIHEVKLGVSFFINSNIAHFCFFLFDIFSLAVSAVSPSELIYVQQ